jgi:hypothetical protein
MNRRRSTRGDETDVDRDLPVAAGPRAKLVGRAERMNAGLRLRGSSVLVAKHARASS